ncbi:hypothetical protein NP493_514g01026 [Ridgeia piscesae]|uniref:Uncharacterized protein n=1 Tax=Ridgeia piscesae TaxID=27915 RepID=A0AAD9KYE8_RIDPI|nr:hypothetical protein NP493_514g01026 [Ridgeia piscesae]
MRSVVNASLPQSLKATPPSVTCDDRTPRLDTCSRANRKAAAYCTPDADGAQHPLTPVMGNKPVISTSPGMYTKSPATLLLGGATHFKHIPLGHVEDGRRCRIAVRAGL